MLRPIVVMLVLALPYAALGRVCKYIDSDGNARYGAEPLDKSWHLVECYGGDGPTAAKPLSRATLFGPPSVLPQCLDRPVTVGVGPSTRARECTRQYCARPEYQAKVAAYAMSRRQSEAEQTDALTCITRSEQDSAKK